MLRLQSAAGLAAGEEDAAPGDGSSVVGIATVEGGFSAVSGGSRAANPNLHRPFWVRSVARGTRRPNKIQGER
jgi:hypothetical protein